MTALLAEQKTANQWILIITIVACFTLGFVIIDLIRTTKEFERERELSKLQTEDALKAQAAAVKDAELKEEQAKNISKEILTPINAIRSLTSLLSDEDISDEAREYLDILNVSADSLANTANEVVGYTNLPTAKDITPESGAELKLFIPMTNILVVDDNLVNLRLIKALLSSTRANVVSVDNGYEAIDRIKNGEEFDIIFMDYLMPGMDGIEATKRIHRLQNEGELTPIIVLTANTGPEQTEEFFAAGMCDFVTKPISLRQLDQALIKWIPREKQQFVKMSEISMEKAIDVYRPERAIKDYWNDYDLFKSVLMLFLDTGDALVPALEETDREEIEIELAKFGRFTRSIRATRLEALINELTEAAIAPDKSLYRSKIYAVRNEYKRVSDTIHEFLDSHDANEGE